LAAATVAVMVAARAAVMAVEKGLWWAAAAARVTEAASAPVGEMVAPASVRALEVVKVGAMVAWTACQVVLSAAP